MAKTVSSLSDLATYWRKRAIRAEQALKSLVDDWESVPPNAQVPDEINVDAHWDAAKVIVAKAEGQ